MELTFGTPAILFSTVSLLLLAFTNRFLALANLIRGMHEKYKEEKDSNVVVQIKSLLVRIQLIRNMQIISILSLLFSAISLLLIFVNTQIGAKWCFGIALVLQIIALIMSVIEISISNKALKLEVSDMKDELDL